MLLGALIGVLWAYRRDPLRRLRRTGSVALVLLPFLMRFRPPNASFWYHGGLSALAIIASMLVFGAVFGDPLLGRLLTIRPLMLAGRLSYAIYLWHLPILVAVARHGKGQTPRVQYSIAAALTMGAATMSWFAVESPARRLRQRLKRHDDRVKVAQQAPWRPLAVGSAAIAVTMTLAALNVT
jgi:peptidoglycan/LPS O-acetylase OafA/YrhL